MTEKLIAIHGRSRDEIAAMAVVAQANLSQLCVAFRKRNATSRSSLDLDVPSPGAVLHFREALIPRESLRGYSDEAVWLRMREMWGQFCLFCWVFFESDPTRPPKFTALPDGQPMRCQTELSVKQMEIEKFLWRMRHEQRLRSDPEARKDPAFVEACREADRIPAVVYGLNVRVCSNEDLVLCSCEYAGMLAAIRWTLDARWTWAAPGIMELDGQPPR
jgi:hypothetical protein